MTISFNYWPRRKKKPIRSAASGETIIFDERVDYVLAFDRNLSQNESRQVLELGGDLLNSNLAVLSFRNFVGRTAIGQIGIEVVSTKIGEGGVSRILQEISDLSSNLIFGWRAPTTFEAASDQLSAPVPYHQLQFLRQMMLLERAGWRFQDYFSIVERSPTRRFEPDRPVVSPERVRRLDHRAIQSIFSRVDRLVPVPEGAAISSIPLAQSLTFGNPRRPHFPAHLAAPRGRLSFDTPENRFVKHVLNEVLSLVYRFVDHPKLHNGLRENCRNMLGILENLAASQFLIEVGRLTALQAPSQALAKADGYREVFAFWVDLTRHFSLPISAAETTRLLEGRDMATLYEYWVFLKILEAAIQVTGYTPSRRPELRRDELGESLAVGLQLNVGPKITIRFNSTFIRSRRTAYSTPLRPDVIVQVGGVLHAFDAKYRLDRFDVAEGDADDDSATYKRADLYKMHTYRDAILGLKTAFIVYPGSEFVFFERSGNKCHNPAMINLIDGVGAVPLRPADADPGRQLRDLLTKILL